MKRILGAAFVMAVISGCGPQQAKVTTETKYTGCVPQNVRVEANTRRMTVIWMPDCKNLISGFNIYISETPLLPTYSGRKLPASVRPFNGEPFPGDTLTDDPSEHFVAEGLTDGVKYYVSVRTVFPGGSLSGPSNEVLTSCGLRREIELPVRLKSNRDGFSLETNEYVSSGDPANDLYFFSKEGRDFLVSPRELDGFLRESKLSVLPFKGEFADVAARVLAVSSLPVENRVEIRQGDWVHLLTADNKNALIKVLEAAGEGGQRRIRLFVAYLAVVGKVVL